MEEFKPVLEPVKTICRCCLNTERPMNSVVNFATLFRDFAGLNVSDSDGLPQWICVECGMLLRKAVRFKYKVLRAHTMLYEYLSRCAPFPIDAQDTELSKYSTPHLCTTNTLVFEVGKGKLGSSTVLEHEKQTRNTQLDAIEISVNVDKEEDRTKEEMEDVKVEFGDFSDYEDNMTLEEYRSNAKITENVTEDDLAELLKVSDDLQLMEEGSRRRKSKRKEDKPKKKKISSVERAEPKPEPKTSIRNKPEELDPTKIRIVTLNPEEQIRMREEESKMNLKFPYQCNLCFKGFNFEVKLQNHLNKHSPSRGQYECTICSMYLPTVHSFGVHSLIHTTRYECLKCGRRMIDRSSIIDHYKTQHEGVLTLFTCHVCGKVSSNSKTHRGHMRNHHSGDRPKCDQCGKTFINKDSLAEHLQIHQGIKNYECVQCGMKFRTRSQVKHHQLKHSDIKEFYCVECDVRFKSAHSLKQHLQKSLKHLDRQSLKFGCDRCEKRFNTSRALSHHVQIQHEGCRPHHCTHCDAALATANSLRKHVASVHRGHRPAARHVCEACGKAFRGKSVLVNHVRTHTGEKPFECSSCGRKFTQRTAMRTHIKLVHLKIRRSAKIKPEMPQEVREPKLDQMPKVDMFPKEETLVFEAWNRQTMAPCDVYFQVTAGP